MTNNMRENIKKNKHMFLEEENLSIINPIKASISNFEKTENYNPDEVFDSLIKHERSISIARNEFNQTTQSSDNEELNNLSVSLDRAERELIDTLDWIENTFEKPYNPMHPHNTECKKTLEKKITDIEE